MFKTKPVMLETLQMASKDRWWDHDEGDSENEDDSKKSVEELIDESEKERIRREEELAKAEHDYKIAQLKRKTDDISAVEVEIRAHNEMYRTRGSINGRPVHFLVDTGATHVSMGTDAVDYIGGKLGKPNVWRTANGKQEGHMVHLEEVEVGGIVVRNIMGGASDGMNEFEAGGQSEMLLGMSFLSEIEVSIEDDVMTLSQTASDAADQEAKRGTIDVDSSRDGGVPPWDGNLQGRGSGNGVLGLWWLSPGEAVSIGLAAMLTIFFFGMGSIVASGEPEWEATDGTILKSEHGWEVWETCDDYECWDEIDCYAYVDYSYRVNDVEYVKIDRYQGMWTEYDYQGAEFDCEHDVETDIFPVGGYVQVWFDVEEPGNSELNAPVDPSIVIFFCCMPIFLLILVVTLVNARFSNGPKYSEVSAVPGHPGHTVVHHHHGGGGPGNFVFFGGVRGGRGGRRHFRRKIASGGRSRGGGGGRSRGGGGRSRGGGGRGGGGRGGGRRR